MQQIQNFEIAPNGSVRGGNASYTVDLDTGIVNFSAKVLLPWYMGSSRSESGTYPEDPKTADPKIFLSSNYTKIGDYLAVGSVTLTITSIDSGVAEVRVDVFGQNVKGNASVDLRGQYVSILQANMQGTSFGIDFNILLNPVLNTLEKLRRIHRWNF